MTLVIVAILLLCYFLIVTENFTNINKAASAIFAGTVAWMVYIVPTTLEQKNYIAQHVFLPYVGRASEIVLFLLATMTIVEILNNNGCFDFVTQLLKTRSAKRMLWTLGTVTFLISINLDNLSTTVMMLTMMHKIVSHRRQRMLYGAAIVVAANCGGAMTVIGDPSGLLLWNLDLVTATNFSMSLLLPCVAAWALTTWLIGKMLPEKVATEWIVMPYRGDDTKLNTWQRLVMLFVGIGGLWFIPTFHNLTQLSPFLGALCVLALLWIVNEVFNRKLMNSGQLVLQRVPSALQYGVMQMMFFVMGLMLVVGIVQETDAIDWFISQSGIYIKNVWAMGAVAAAISSLLDNFATALSFISLNAHAEQNDMYWKIVSFASGVGGNLLCIGSVSGLALMKMENMRLGWYVQHVTWRVLCGLIVGYGVLFFVV